MAGGVLRAGKPFFFPSLLSLAEEVITKMQFFTRRQRFIFTVL